MKLKELIQSVSKDIEILDTYTRKSIFGMNIDYVFFKIRSHYYLVSKSVGYFEGYLYVLTEQTPDGSKDISRPKVFEEIELKEYIKRLVILEN